MEQKRARMRRSLTTARAPCEIWRKFHLIFGSGLARPQLAVVVARLMPSLAGLIGRDSSHPTEFQFPPWLTFHRPSSAWRNELEHWQRGRNRRLSREPPCMNLRPRRESRDKRSKLRRESPGTRPATQVQTSKFAQAHSFYLHTDVTHRHSFNDLNQCHE